MKFTKEKIRESVGQFGVPVLVAGDDFSTLTVKMDNKTELEHHDYYYRSVFRLYFEQLVTHRPQETRAVLENVAKSIHDSLYREIIVGLHRIKHEAHYVSRDEIVHMITKLIDKLEE